METKPTEIPLRYKYRSDKNGVPSYPSRGGNNNPKRRTKSTGRGLEAQQAITAEHKRVLVLKANGKRRLMRASALT